MGGNICRCGTYPKMRRRSPVGEADPHREGSRRPFRGNLAGRRGGSARPVAGGVAARSWPACAPRRRTRARQRARPGTRRTSCFPGMLHAADPAVAVRARDGDRIERHAPQAAPGVRADARARAIRPTEGRSGLPRPPVPRSPPTPLGRCPARQPVDVEREVLEPLIDPEEAVARGSPDRRRSPLRPRRRCERLRRGRRSGRGRLSHTDGAAQPARAAPVHLRMGRRQLHVYTSTQFIWGVRDDVAAEFDLPKDKVRVVCDSWAEGWREERRRRLHVCRRQSHAGRAARCAAR